MILKSLLLFVSFLSLASATLIVGPIPISGSGFYEYSFPADGYQQAAASGSDGTHGVSFAVENVTSSTTGPSFFMRAISGSYNRGWAYIDEFYSTNFYVSFSDGGGSLVLYDTSNQIIASASLVGYLANHVETGNHFEYSGRYAIVPAPEPATFALAGVALGLLSLRRRKRQRR
ncbi:PEP-CTERM sorting domain-containing protein [Bryobacter aggregatus]|uniref:PEP-CTERM sorting domain-containing protein n=1 Tax=Bryobacter aggregatus TaxID=360054 RepID=UPI0004E12F6F|nr:PEP-CTERM sorting domain-containing protein [Bryobacter aggregatus]